MSPPVSPEVQQTRAKLQAMAEELVELFKTYSPQVPSQGQGWGIPDPIVLKARQFVNEAQTPMDHATAIGTTTMETASIRTLLHLKAIQNIPLKGSISLEDLSQKTGAEAALLERLLRAVVSSGFILKDASDGNFSHSHISLGYALPGFATRFTVIYDEGLTRLIRLPEYLEHQKAATGKYEEPGASRDNMMFNLETWVAGFEGEKSTFQIMESDPERMKRFQSSQASSSNLQPYTGLFDFSKLATDEPGRMALVDVGGGHGHAIAAILEAHGDVLKPEQCVLEDTEQVVKFAQETNDSIPAGVHFQPHDFFKTQPIRGAKGYYLRAVLHDLSDDNSVRVLRHIVDVMEKDSRILISDSVVPEKGSVGMTAMMDMMMMVIGGKERTEGNFRDVCEKAGLKVDAIWRTDERRTHAVVEASLK